MPVITLTAFQVVCKNVHNGPRSSRDESHSEFVTTWHLEIHGLEKSEIPYLQEKIPTFHRKSVTVLTTELLREDPDSLGQLPQFHPPMGRVTKVLNRLDGIGYKIISSTTITNPDQRHCIIWTFLK